MLNMTSSDANIISFVVIESAIQYAKVKVEQIWNSVSIISTQTWVLRIYHILSLWQIQTEWMIWCQHRRALLITESDQEVLESLTFFPLWCVSHSDCCRGGQSQWGQSMDPIKIFVLVELTHCDNWHRIHSTTMVPGNGPRTAYLLIF